METTYIARLFFTEARFYSRRTLVGSGLDRFLGLKTGLDNVIEEYKLFFRGIIVQNLGTSELEFVTIGDKIVFREGGSERCRWHSGPIEERDNPMERTYCLNKIYTGLGYCREHMDSWRAVYTRCFSSSGLQSLGACRRLDSFYRDRIRYTLYLLDYGGGLKVGVTRSFRLYERVGEQPHVVATALAEYKSAFKARDTERTIGSMKGFTEAPKKRSIYRAIAFPPRTAFTRLYRVAEKIRAELGGEGELKLFRVIPTIEPHLFLRATVKDVKEIYNLHLEIIGYWAGYLLASPTTSNEYYLVKANTILHKDLVGVLT